MDIILSVLPTVLTVTLAFITRNVYASLLAGLLVGSSILSGYNIFTAVDAVINYIVGVFASGGNITTMMAILLLGGLIHLLDKSGGVQGFLEYLTTKTQLINSKKKANLFSWLIGVAVFVSANMSSLIVGAISKPVNDKYLTSHEKLAFITHTGSCPVCVLIPVSSWGAYMISLLESNGIENAAGVMLKSIPLSIYVIIAVFAVPLMIIFNLDFGPMKKAELRAETLGQLDAPGRNQVAESSNPTEIAAASSLILILPVATMIIVTVWGMYVTGGGNILQGAGMRSFLWGVLAGIFIATVMIKSKKILGFNQIGNYVYKGFESMMPVIIILIFALAMGDLIKDLNTGELLAGAFAGILSPAILPLIVFFITMIICFSTGSSWGTWAVIMPISIPMALAMDVNVVLLAAAIWSGGIFGDQSSPLSDTTVVVSAATGCDIIDHIKTQLPYTLTFAAISAGVFLILGFIL